MKRILSGLLAVVCCGAFAAETDFGEAQTLSSPWAKMAPTLDGVLSPLEWDEAAKVEIDGSDKTRPGVASGDSNTVNQEKTGGILPKTSNYATFYVKNDDKYLYVAIDCTDDILDFATKGGEAYLNDGCEVLVDGNYSRLEKKEDTRFGGIAVIRGDGGRAELNGADISPLNFSGRAKEDGTGWVAELRWDKTDFAETIGFDVIINDSDDPKIEKRHGQYFWNSTKDITWQDEREWGTVKLAKTPAMP